MVSENQNLPFHAQSDFSWHSHSVEDVMAHLAVSAEGLSEEEREQRQKRYGPNALTQARPPSAIYRFLLQ